jgi:hypothetical protein
VPTFDVSLADEALFVVPGTGALWVFDFGNKTEVLREADAANHGAMFQVAQATVGDFRMFLVLPTFAAPSLGEQARIIGMLSEYDPSRPVAQVVQHSRGDGTIVAGEAKLAMAAAAAAAVVKTCWEWDESGTFKFSIDMREYTVVVEHDGEHWRTIVDRELTDW